MDLSREIDVLQLEEEAFTEFVRSLSAVPIITRGVEGVVPGWSTHDVVWHVTYWVGRAAEVLERAREGPPFPDEPEEGSYYDAQNDAVFSLGREMSWVDLMRQHATNRARMRSALAASTGSVREWMEQRAPRKKSSTIACTQPRFATSASRDRIVSIVRSNAGW